MPMQMNRLFEIIYLLMERKSVTAKELAEHFEVSPRTIYRDIETLSAAGIPVYASRGTGGGIRIMDEFVLNKSVLSEQERGEILASLQGLSAIRSPDAAPVLAKLGALFGGSGASWIDVDFSCWGGGDAERHKFTLLKTAILQKRVIAFDYYGSDGGKSERAAEPLKLLFKGMAWYLYAFCRVKQAFRIFKITRMKNLSLREENFDRPIPEHVFEQTDTASSHKTISFHLKIDASFAFRVYDEFDPESVQKNPDGSFTVGMTVPQGGWIFGFLLSFGECAEVLEPDWLRREVAERAEKILKLYQ
ncbi:MAG TPA: YafY family protein [Caproiciproducens sp.]|nr:YafY family protein [Caproiciproducens sp.]